eukprot:172929-Chlamydomonas_euryale.AAC.3
MAFRLKHHYCRIPCNHPRYVAMSVPLLLSRMPAKQTCAQAHQPPACKLRACKLSTHMPTKRTSVQKSLERNTAERILNAMFGKEERRFRDPTQAEIEALTLQGMQKVGVGCETGRGRAAAASTPHNRRRLTR